MVRKETKAGYTIQRGVELEKERFTSAQSSERLACVRLPEIHLIDFRLLGQESEPAVVGNPNKTVHPSPRKLFERFMAAQRFIRIPLLFYIPNFIWAGYNAQ
jgi:hypothetical protein